jgi:hypothetical protein
LPLPPLIRSARHYLGLATTVVILGTILFTRRLEETTDKAFEPRPSSEILKSEPLHFREEAASLGLDYRHELFYPNPGAKSYLPLMAFPPAIAVADVDGDGFMDIYVVQPAPGRPNRLYHNEGGAHFRDIAREVGLDDAAKTQGDSMALWIDFNRDGKLDLLQTRWGCHTLFVQDPAGGRFSPHRELLDHYCSNPAAVNMADFNRDGWVDLIFGNYYPSGDLAKYLPLNHVFGFSGQNYTGGESMVLLGSDAGFRRPPPSELQQPSRPRSHTTAMGISDVNDDGWPDIFEANDYASDRLFLNRSGRQFEDVTRSYLPDREHGVAGMNGDFADFDNDGRLGVFVSGGYVPPFVTSMNILWKNLGDGFANVASDRGVGRCGWAWTAKFADFDNDGNLDLFVINGKARGENTRPDKFKSFSFVRNTIAALPPQARYDISLWPDFSNFALSAYQRSCLFWNKDGHFYDVAPEAGVTDLEEGQAAALVDYDNDGRIDVVVANMNGPLMLYHNVTPSPGNWVGISLLGMPNGVMPLGARVILHRPDGTTPTRELYPANGYRGQNDPRIHFGLGALAAVPEVEVRWPDGKIEFFRSLRINAYQNVVYGQGTPS